MPWGWLLFRGTNPSSTQSINISYNFSSPICYIHPCYLPKNSVTRVLYCQIMGHFMSVFFIFIFHAYYYFKRSYNVNTYRQPGLDSLPSYRGRASNNGVNEQCSHFSSLFISLNALHHMAVFSCIRILNFKNHLMYI